VSEVLGFENDSARGGVYQCRRGTLSLEGEIVRYLGVSLGPTLRWNEKVEKHIRKKTHKPNALRFLVEGGVVPLCGLTLFSFLFVSLVFLPLNFSSIYI